MRFFITVLIGALSMVSGFGQGQPSIQFDSVSRDAGTVEQGDVIKQVFIFTNKGSGILEVFNIEHS